jgi:hypothetical protein
LKESKCEYIHFCYSNVTTLLFLIF